MAVCALTLFLALPCHAGYWDVSYTSQGVSGYDILDGFNPTDLNTAPGSDPWPKESTGGGSYSVYMFGEVNHFSHGTVTATLTWFPANGDITTDPPDKTVYIQETATAQERAGYWYGIGTQPDMAGTVDNGLGNSVTAIWTGASQVLTCTGTRLIQRDGSSGKIVLDPVSLSAATPTTSYASGYVDWFGSGWASVSLDAGIETRAVMNIVPVRVDATSPHSSRVFYRIEPDDAVASSVTFAGPTSTGTGTQTLSNVTGEFSFTFDEAELPAGSSSFVLNWTPASPYIPLDGTSVNVGATRRSLIASGSSPLGAWVTAGDPSATPIGGPNGNIQRIPMTPYELYELYDKFSYSIPVVAESQTIYAASNSVNIGTPELMALPSTIAGWGETHHYNYQFADYGISSMTSVTGATLPAQGNHFQSKNGVGGLFFAPGHNLTGIAHCDSLMFTSEEYQGIVLPVFLDAIASDTQTIVVDIE